MKEDLYNMILTRVEREEPRMNPRFLVHMIGWTDTPFTQPQNMGQRVWGRLRRRTRSCVGNTLSMRD